MPEPIQIVPLTPAHWSRVREIYLEGIRGGQATFEIEPPSWEDWDAAHLAACRFVARIGGRTVGFAGLSPYSRRPVYAGVADLTLYVSGDFHGRGVGSALMAELIRASESAGFWTLQAGIFPENEKSLALHERFEFRVVGTRERLGRMTLGPLAGQWRDVVLMERRSRISGT